MESASPLQEVGVTLTNDDVEQMIDQAKEFPGATKHYLAKAVHSV